ncbi:MAG: riboflavin biosynthesis protein RibF [Planctomycetota bacterium]|jgi:riboflavin kinase/FMN adenylyltransferase
METVFSLSRARKYPNTIATLGVFDGVHLGHKAVLSETSRWAVEIGGTAVVITFDRHPERVLKGKAPESLTSLEHRLHLISRTDMDVCVVLHFGRELAGTEPEEFARAVFADSLGVKGVVLGYNCRFGRGGAGTPELLAHLGARWGFEVKTVGPLAVDGAPVSSTRVRQLVESGEIEGAARLLGRPFTLRGTVVHGQKRGGKLGFPTANLNLHHEATPPGGVYICRASLDSAQYWGLLNVGVRPTFSVCGEGGRKHVEVYLYGFPGGDLYGGTLEVEVLKFLREEARFDSPGALAAQIERDRRTLEAFIGAAGGTP